MTHRGDELAEVVPTPVAEEPRDWFGKLAGTFDIVGDIMKPASDPEDWEVLRDT